MFCDYRSKPANVKRHQILCEQKQLYDNICDLCGAKCKTKDGLRMHTKNYH